MINWYPSQVISSFPKSNELKMLAFSWRCGMMHRFRFCTINKSTLRKPVDGNWLLLKTLEIVNQFFTHKRADFDADCHKLNCEYWCRSWQQTASKKSTKFYKISRNKMTNLEILRKDHGMSLNRIFCLL